MAKALRKAYTACPDRYGALQNEGLWGKPALELMRNSCRDCFQGGQRTRQLSTESQTGGWLFIKIEQRLAASVGGQPRGTTQHTAAFLEATQY